MIKSNVQKEEILRGCGSRKVVFDGRRRHGDWRVHINSKHTSENKVGRSSELSNPTFSGVFPSARMQTSPNTNNWGPSIQVPECKEGIFHQTSIVCKAVLHISEHGTTPNYPCQELRCHFGQTPVQCGPQVTRLGSFYISVFLLVFSTSARYSSFEWSKGLLACQKLPRVNQDIYNTKHAGGPAGRGRSVFHIVTCASCGCTQPTLVIVAQQVQGMFGHVILMHVCFSQPHASDHLSSSQQNLNCLLLFAKAFSRFFLETSTSFIFLITGIHSFRAQNSVTQSDNNPYVKQRLSLLVWGF